MSEVIITPDYDGLYDDWFDPPMEIKMSCKNNEDIVINTTKGLEVVPIPHQIAYDLATEGPITITTTGGSEVFNVPTQ
tara:strand:+ start:473 stop:706 length:234 start_codon:yes stop_codon:yes gene_type:complete